MSIKIISLNLFEGGVFWENILEFFNRENADIYCLQEAGDGNADQPLPFQTLERFRKVFPNFHFYYTPEMYQIWSKNHSVWPGAEGDAGNLIISRFPITSQQTTFIHGEYGKFHRPEDEKDFRHYPKNMQHVTVKVEDQELHVFNLHGVWGFDGDDNPDRLEMSRKIVKEISGKSPAVLMGDFNVQPNTQTIDQIEEHMVNVFKDELSTSFNMRHKTNPSYGTAVVDMIFATSELKIISKSCPEDDVSDHKPLVVEVEW